jgi:lipoate synthase
VRQKVTHILSIQNLMSRNKGMRLSADKIRQLTDAEVERLLPQADRALAVKSNLAVYRCRVEEIDRLEKVVKQRPSFQWSLRIKINTRTEKFTKKYHSYTPAMKIGLTQSVLTWRELIMAPIPISH